MAKKKKKEVFSVTKAVKAAARLKVGKVKATRPIPDAKTKQRRKGAKHKTTLAKLITTEQ